MPFPKKIASVHPYLNLTKDPWLFIMILEFNFYKTGDETMHQRNTRIRLLLMLSIMLFIATAGASVSQAKTISPLKVKGTHLVNSAMRFLYRDYILFQIECKNNNNSPICLSKSQKKMQILRFSTGMKRLLCNYWTNLPSRSHEKSLPLQRQKFPNNYT